MTPALDPPPYGSYAAIAGVFLGGIATVAALGRRAPTGSLGAAGANDFLHAGFKALCAKANELEDET